MLVPASTYVGSGAVFLYAFSVCSSLAVKQIF